MKTEGKAVDSVIQYQLHKDSKSEENANIKFVKRNYEANHIITQEEYDKYNQYFEDMTVGATVVKQELEITPNYIDSGILYIVYREFDGEFSYKIIDGISFNDSDGYFDLVAISGINFYSPSINDSYCNFGSVS